MGYEINTQKSAAFLYINNERSEIEIQKAITFTIASKRIKCLGINLPKEAKALYFKTYKALMKEIEADTEMERYIIFLDWKNQHCQKTILFKAVYRFNAVLSNYQWHFSQN